jgi:hypothetical protein
VTGLRIALCITALSAITAHAGAQDSGSNPTMAVDGKRVSSKDLKKVSRDIEAFLKAATTPGSKAPQTPKTEVGRILNSISEQSVQANLDLAKVIRENRISSIAAAPTFQNIGTIHSGLLRIDAVRDAESKWTETKISLAKELSSRFATPGFNNRMMQSVNETLRYLEVLNDALDVVEDYLVFAKWHHPVVTEGSNIVRWPKDELPEVKTYISNLKDALRKVTAASEVLHDQEAQHRIEAKKALSRLQSAS